MKKLQPIDAGAVLQEHGFKRTPLRTLLLEVLSVSPTPLPISKLERKLKKTGADTATVYRALHAFVEAGIVNEVTLDKTKALYELARDSHVHHIVCDTCSAVECVPFCVRSIDRQVTQVSKQFKKIHTHQLSFVGTCRKCLRALR